MSSLVLLLSVIASPPLEEPHPGYLFHMQVGADQSVQLQSERYRPQPGDLLLFDDHSPMMTKIYHWCGTSRPLHAGIVFRKADGSPAILEAGTNAVMKVFNFELGPRLHDFNGTILVRVPRRPLTAEDGQRLTDFAQAQEGKRYAIGRLMMQATPFRPRNTLFAKHFGRTVIDRDRWICSELAVAAATAAGIWELDTFPANVMYPRDLCYDERFDLSPYYQPPALWYPRPELERVGAGVRVGRPVD